VEERDPEISHNDMESCTKVPTIVMPGGELAIVDGPGDGDTGSKEVAKGI
jgi:hypothetical protein